MGCDIHIFTEVNKDDKWISCDHFKLNDEKKYDVYEIYQGRNYELFSILADVRNYHDNKIICKPKGIPNNCNDMIKNKYAEDTYCFHSSSYFTLKELKEFYKNNPLIKHAGFMTKENAKLVDKGKMPNSWCQGTTRNDYVYREWSHHNSQLKYLIEKIQERKLEEFYDCYYIKDNHDEDIRIIFWFDN